MAVIPVKGGVFNGSFDLGTGTLASNSGFIGAEQYGWQNIQTSGGNITSSYDVVPATATKCIKMVATNLLRSSGGSNISAVGIANTKYSGGTISLDNLKWLVPATAGDVYLFGGDVYIEAIHSQVTFGFVCVWYDVNMNRLGTSSSSGLQTTGVLTTLSNEFTAPANTAFASISARFTASIAPDFTGGTGTGYVSRIFFEEKSTVTNPGSAPVTYRPTLEAVTSVDSVDQYLDETGVYASTYTVTASINETATHRQTFVAQRKFLAFVSVKIPAKGTGNWKVAIHDASNNLVGGVTDANSEMTNASITAGAFNKLPAMAILTPGQTYHFHLICESADGTVTTNVASDLEACSYILYYGKKTDTFKVRTATESLEIEAGADGFLHGQQLDLHKKQMLYAGRYSLTNGQIDKVPWLLDVFSYSGYPSTNTPWTISSIGLSANTGWSFVIKKNLIYPTSSIALRFLMQIAATRSCKLQYSYNNTDWVDIGTYTNSDDNQSRTATIAMNGETLIYFRFISVSSTCYLREFDVTADIDISSITLPTLAVGANTVYYSSNSKVDSAGVDPSQQMRVTAVVPVAPTKSLRYAVRQAGAGLIGLGLTYKVRRPGVSRKEVILNSNEQNQITLPANKNAAILPAKTNDIIL